MTVELFARPFVACRDTNTKVVQRSLVHEHVDFLLLVDCQDEMNYPKNE